MTPQEQEAIDKDPNHVSKDEIEKRIVSVDYSTGDYGNQVRCTITMDNGFRALGSSIGFLHGDIGQTAAYDSAFRILQTAFNFLRAEQLYWVRAQQREQGMLAAFGVQNGD
jgi:hypothetical protein